MASYSSVFAVKTNKHLLQKYAKHFAQIWKNENFTKKSGYQFLAIMNV